MQFKLKKIYTAVALSLLIALYIVIFCFSAEDGESSSVASASVTEALLRGYYGLIGKSDTNLTEMVILLEGFIRKLAHFMEYMCMGFLSFSMIVIWHDISSKGVWAVLAQVFLSAALDEFHQYFIPGRWASPKDVLIDTAGGFAGISVILLWKRFRPKKIPSTTQ